MPAAPTHWTLEPSASNTGSTCPASGVWSRGENGQVALLSRVGASRDRRIEQGYAVVGGDPHESVCLSRADAAHLQPDRLFGPLIEQRLDDR